MLSLEQGLEQEQELDIIDFDDGIDTLQALKLEGLSDDTILELERICQEVELWLHAH